MSVPVRPTFLAFGFFVQTLAAHRLARPFAALSR